MPLDRPSAGSFGARVMDGLLRTMTYNLQQRRTMGMEQEARQEDLAARTGAMANRDEANFLRDRAERLAAEERGRTEFDYRRTAGLEDYEKKAEIDAAYRLAEIIARGQAKGGQAEKPPKPYKAKDLLLLIDKIPDLEGAFTPGDKWDMAEFMAETLEPGQEPTIEHLNYGKKFVVGENLASTVADERFGVGVKLGEALKKPAGEAVREKIFAPDDVTSVLAAYGLLSGPVPVGRNYSAEDVARLVAHNAEDPLIFQRPAGPGEGQQAAAELLATALWDLTMDYYNSKFPEDETEKRWGQKSPGEFVGGAAGGVIEALQRLRQPPTEQTGRTGLGQLLNRNIDRFFWTNKERAVGTGAPLPTRHPKEVRRATGN